MLLRNRTRTRITLLLGIATTVLAQAPAEDRFPFAPARRTTPLLRGSEQAWRDFTYHYWDPDIQPPRLRPTVFDGTIRNDATYPTFWHMAEAHNVLYWRWKTTGSGW